MPTVHTCGALGIQVHQFPGVRVPRQGRTGVTWSGFSQVVYRTYTEERTLSREASGMQHIWLMRMRHNKQT